MKGFIGKGRFKGLLEQVQVKLSLNPKTPLIGAMNYYR
jgi:glucokinase